MNDWPRVKDLFHAALEREVEVWWCNALEGELAVARGDAQHAAAVFASSEPRQRWFAIDLFDIGFLANHLPLRDGPARATKARGDLPTAIASYRQLLTFGPQSKWISRRARAAIRAGARAVTGRVAGVRAFLELWKQADPNLPEVGEARRAVARLRASGTDRRPGDYEE